MDFRDLKAYQLGFELAMEVFEISKCFPKEERYALTDQIRRSTRSVFANIAEAYRKRLYPAHYTSKLTDSDGENAETQVWIGFALSCNYINQDKYNSLLQKSESVGNLIGYMIRNPEKFGVSK
ncbi:MAG: four helix bundle protein [Saprospiraceae bacterium]|nr:four helix bundle protein [Saprospiraceae bacterium]